MKDWTFDSRGPDESLEIAAELGRSIGEPGLAIGLMGPLGAGKTVFVKGLARGLGVDPRLVSSPTFVIAQQYPLQQGPRVLHHLDFYRLASAMELETIGFDDMWARGCVLAVEWADRFPEALAGEGLEIALEGPSALTSPSEEASPEDASAGWEEAAHVPRRGRVKARGAEAERVLQDWAARVERLQLASGAPNGPGAGPDREKSEREEGHREGGVRMLAVLLLAAGLAGLAAAAGPPDALPLCHAPRVLALDALGVERVRCEPSSATDARRPLPPEAGLGGLLFGQLLDLNRASAPVLEALPGIGPARARAILAERDRQGSFERVADLERVPGIGPVTRGRLEAWVAVGLAEREREEVGGRKAMHGIDADIRAPEARPPLRDGLQHD